MPFQFCLIPNRALDSTVALYRGHTQSHPVIVNWLSYLFPNGPIATTFFAFNILYMFLSSFIPCLFYFGPFFIILRVEMTHIFMWFELSGWAIWYQLSWGNQTHLPLERQGEGMTDRNMPQESQGKFEGIVLFFSIYFLFRLISVMNGKTPVTAWISVAKIVFCDAVKKSWIQQILHLCIVYCVNITFQCHYIFTQMW